MSSRERNERNPQGEVSELIKKNQQIVSTNRFVFSNSDLQLYMSKGWRELTRNEIMLKEKQTTLMMANHIAESAKDFMGNLDEEAIGFCKDIFMKQVSQKVGKSSVIAVFEPMDRKDVSISISKFPEDYGFTIAGYEKLVKVGSKAVGMVMPLLDLDFKVDEVNKTKVDGLDARECKAAVTMKDKEPNHSVNVFTISNNEIYSIALNAPQAEINEYNDKYFKDVVQSIKFYKKTTREKITRGELEVALLMFTLQNKLDFDFQKFNFRAKDIKFN